MKTDQFIHSLITSTAAPVAGFVVNLLVPGYAFVAYGAAIAMAPIVFLCSYMFHSEVSSDDAKRGHCGSDGDGFSKAEWRFQSYPDPQKSNQSGEVKTLTTDLPIPATWEIVQEGAI